MKEMNLFIYSVITIVVGISLPARLSAQPRPSLPVVTNLFYSSSGKWVQVSNTNCVIWNSWPREGESVTWSGGVVDGKAQGKGTVQWFTNGVPTTRYIGELKGGLADGHGISKGPLSEFEGEWSRGSFVSTNGTIKYPNGNWYKGEIMNGFKTGNGDSIIGDWRDSKLEGIGTYQMKSGGSFRVRQTEAGIERL